MRILQIIGITCIVLLSVLACTAQEKELAKDQFYSAFRAAFAKTRSLNRRNISKTERFTEGKLTSTDEWQYEYDGSDKTHYVHITSGGGKTTRIEEIDIGKTSYCKKNDGPWELSGGCIGGSASGSPSGDTRYTMQTTKLDNKDCSLLREYAVYKDNYSTNKDTEGLAFSEWKVWIDKDGLLIREESTKGLVEPKTIRSSTINTYEYDPGIKVEAPIKLQGEGNGIGTGSGSGYSEGTGTETPPPPASSAGTVRILSKPAARSTKEACDAEFSGSVMLRVTFLKTGEIGAISVIKGAPYGLNEQAIEAAKHLKFEPAQLNGEPTTVAKSVEYHFNCM